MAKPWTLAPPLVALREQVNKRCPQRRKDSDGSIGDVRHAKTKSDHNPNARGMVNAIDLTHCPESGFDAEAFFQQLVTRKDMRLKYAIFNGRIVSSTEQPWVVRPYKGSNPHKTHIHISCVDNCPVDSQWQLGRQPGDDSLLSAGTGGIFHSEDRNLFAMSSLIQLAPVLLKALRLAESVSAKVKRGEPTADILRDDVGPALSILQAIGAEVFPHLPEQKQVAAGALRTRTDYVREVQTMLKARGADLEVDGEYGPITRTAIEAFQRGNALVVDGYIGPKTYAGLVAVSAGKQVQT